MDIIKYMNNSVISGFFEDAKNLTQMLQISEKNPAVDVEKIASILNLQIKKDKHLTEKHAVLNDSVITLNASDSLQQRRFSIAHEIAHIITKDKVSVKVGKKNNPDLKISYSFKNQELREVAREIANTKKLHQNIFANWENLSELAKDLYEEVMDYFAAVLLVPSDIFCALLDKTDTELSRLFKVKPACIAKRRKELRYEFDVFGGGFQPVVVSVADPMNQNEIDGLLGRI